MNIGLRLCGLTSGLIVLGAFLPATALAANPSTTTPAGLMSDRATRQLGAPLRPQSPLLFGDVGADLIPDLILMDVGAGSLRVERHAVASEHAEWLDPAIVVITATANSRTVHTTVSAGEVLSGLRAVRHPAGDGRVLVVVEVSEHSIGSGVYWQTRAVVLSMPASIGEGAPEFLGWAPVATFGRQGISWNTSECAEILLQPDGSLTLRALLWWYRGDPEPSAPWRELPHDQVNDTDPSCLTAADEHGVALLTATHLVQDMSFLDPADEQDPPWAFRELPEVTVTAIAPLPESIEPDYLLPMLENLGALRLPRCR